jgi:ATP-dependent protease ClpP protease subunit
MKKISPELFTARPERTIAWIGGVHHDNLDRVIGDIKRLMIDDPDEKIYLLVTSGGGGTGIAMSFYDAVTSWLRPKLITLGSGDVDSSGVIIFLAGEERYVTQNTTMFFHLAGRTFHADRRFSTADMDAMLKEDILKDYHYASVVSGRTNGKYSPEDILDLMKMNTLITPREALDMGLAHKVLE